MFFENQLLEIENFANFALKTDMKSFIYILATIIKLGGGAIGHCSPLLNIPMSKATKAVFSETNGSS